METKRGKIEKKEESSGESAKGTWNRHCFTIDGKKYSTFDVELAGKFKVGDYVEMSGQQEGKFWNMDGMKMCDELTKEQEDTIDAHHNSDVIEDLLRKILVELKEFNG